MDSDGNPSSNVKATLGVQNLLTQKTLSRLICDREYRQSIAGTIEYIRLSEVCKITVENDVSYTDTLGQARFPNFAITRYFPFNDKIKGSSRYL